VKADAAATMSRRGLVPGGQLGVCAGDAMYLGLDGRRPTVLLPSSLLLHC
jgi:hypothetical protein